MDYRFFKQAQPTAAQLTDVITRLEAQYDLETKKPRPDPDVLAQLDAQWTIATQKLDSGSSESDKAKAAILDREIIAATSEIVNEQIKDIKAIEDPAARLEALKAEREKIDPKAAADDVADTAQEAAIAAP